MHSPGRWPIVWSRRWRCLRSSAALACPRNGWPLYSTQSPVQPALRGVLEPRRLLLPGPEAQTSRAGGSLCTHQEGGLLSGAEDGTASLGMFYVLGCLHILLTLSIKFNDLGISFFLENLLYSLFHYQKYTHCIQKLSTGISKMSYTI